MYWDPLVLFIIFFVIVPFFCVMLEMAVFHFLRVICLFRPPNPVTCVRSNFSRLVDFVLKTPHSEKNTHQKPIHFYQWEKKHTNICMINGYLCCDCWMFGILFVSFTLKTGDGKYSLIEKYAVAKWEFSMAEETKSSGRFSIKYCHFELNHQLSVDDEDGDDSWYECVCIFSSFGPSLSMLFVDNLHTSL